MIENLKYDEKTVSWNTKSGKRVEKTHNSISNVLTNSKEVYVLYRENDRDDVVIVYSGEGELLGELHNTDLKLLEKMKSNLNLSENGEASLRRMVYGMKFNVIKSCLFRNLE